RPAPRCVPPPPRPPRAPPALPRLTRTASVPPRGRCSDMTAAALPVPDAIWHNTDCHMAGGAMGVIGDVIQALGGPGLVPARSAAELRDALRAGLPYA